MIRSPTPKYVLYFFLGALCSLLHPQYQRPYLTQYVLSLYIPLFRVLQFFGDTFGIEYTLPKMVLSEGTVMWAEYCVWLFRTWCRCLGSSLPWRIGVSQCTTGKTMFVVDVKFVRTCAFQQGGTIAWRGKLRHWRKVTAKKNNSFLHIFPFRLGILLMAIG